MPAPRPARVLLGPLVLAALMTPTAADAQVRAPPEPPAAGTGAAATRPLDVGSRGARVREIQRVLGLTAWG